MNSSPVGQDRTQRFGVAVVAAGMFTNTRAEKRAEPLDAASLRQQRRLKQALQFLHRDSADLLPLDGLKKLGTAKQGVSCTPRALKSHIHTFIAIYHTKLTQFIVLLCLDPADNSLNCLSVLYLVFLVSVRVFTGHLVLQTLIKWSFTVKLKRYVYICLIVKPNMQRLSKWEMFCSEGCHSNRYGLVTGAVFWCFAWSFVLSLAATPYSAEAAAGGQVVTRSDVHGHTKQWSQSQSFKFKWGGRGRFHLCALQGELDTMTSRSELFMEMSTRVPLLVLACKHWEAEVFPAF